MKIVIRADASIKIGSGHIMRCITLATYLKRHADFLFLCRPHKGNLIAFIKQKGFSVKVLKKAIEFEDSYLYHSKWLGATQEEDARQCHQVLKEETFDWMIIDHYSLDKTWETAMSKCYRKLLVIDELADRQHICDVLLDQTYGVKEKKYSKLVSENCYMLNGSDFALLRPQFAEWREKSLRNRQSPNLHNILINLGGVDADNLTSKLLVEINNCILPENIKISVILGQTAPHLQEVLNLANSSHYKIEVRTGVSDIERFMAIADLAIGAAGTTTWERCCLGLPTIQLVVAENQITVSEALTKINATILLDSVENLKSALIKAQENLKDLSKNSLNIVDGNGALRVSQLILFGDISSTGYALIPYQSLTRKKSLEILAMRNHPEIRKWMHIKSPITENTHYKFIEKLASNKHCRFLVLKNNQKTIGTINFSNIDQIDAIAEFGIYANPFLNEKERGKKLMNAAILYAKNNLKLKLLNLAVYEENVAAISLYKKYGFVLRDNDREKQQTLIHMSKVLN